MGPPPYIYMHQGRNVRIAKVITLCSRKEASRSSLISYTSGEFAYEVIATVSADFVDVWSTSGLGLSSNLLMAVSLFKRLCIWTHAIARMESKDGERYRYTIDVFAK